MKTGSALIVGISGGIAMTLLGWIVRRMGIEMNPRDDARYDADCARARRMDRRIRDSHDVLDGVRADLRVGIRARHARSGLLVGLAFAVVHVILAGPVMAAIPGIHPMIPETMMAPGAFMSGMGATGVFLFALEHLIYGGIVGAMYGPVQHPVGSTYAATTQ